MHAPISSPDLATLIDEADVAARRLHRRLALPAVDLDDLRQDLLAELIARLPAFDANRGTFGAFANIVLRNRSSRIAVRHHRQRRIQGGTMLSLDTPVAGFSEPLCGLLAGSDGSAPWHGSERCALADAEASLSVRCILAKLSAEDRRLCAALVHRSVLALAAAGFGSRSALYRRVADLRFVLAAHGLGSGRDESATA